MAKYRSSKQLISAVVAIIFFAAPLVAQRRPAAPRKPPAQTPAPKPAPAPAPTFDTLLAADSYRVYAEVRGVGQLVRSPAVTDLLDPMMKLGGPSKEFKSLVKWLNQQADALAGSRMLVASWAAQPKLPVVLVAIEFDSPEEAQKFDPKVRRLLPTLISNPTPTPTPELPGERAAGPAVATPSPTAPAPESGPAPPPYTIKQVGSLLLITDKPFALKDLKPRGSKLLSEDQNFATARNRFASEPLFVYIDTKSIQKEQEEQFKKYDEEQKQRELEAANQPPVEIATETPDAELPSDVVPPVVDETPPQFEPSPVPEGSPPGELSPSLPSDTTSTLTVADPPAREGLGEPMTWPLAMLLFGGQSNWPEAVGIAAALEGDAYVLRTLIINGSDNKANAIPFVPQFVSGPPLVPDSPNIFPADTELFAAVSLDYHQVYEGMLKAATNFEEMSRKIEGRPSMGPMESPFIVFEKRAGIKIKDDLLPLLGNEVALALPKVTPTPARSPAPTPEDGKDKSAPPAPPDPSPVIAISIRDRDAVRKLIPRVIESWGFKGAGLLAQTERRDDTEIVSYGGVFSYAFVGNFLVFSTDPAATRHTVDSFLNHETLSSNSHFRNSIRWQPRQLLGQLYLAPNLVERYYPMAMAGAHGEEEMRNFLYRLNPVIDPLSYSLTDDGLGPLHELHVPRNMLTLMVAGLAKDEAESPLVNNESRAKGVLRTLVSAEETFKAMRDDGRYGSIEELRAASLVAPNFPETRGYRIEISVSGNKFEATAVPLEYGTTGWLSYFIDESGLLRGGDRGGGSATVADNPIQ